MELSKEQIKALAAVLYDEIYDQVITHNKEALEEIKRDESFKNAFNEFTEAIKKADAIRRESEKIEKEAIKGLKSKLSNIEVWTCNDVDTLARRYGRRIGRIKEDITKVDIMNRITLATIDAKDLATLKENVLKMF